MHRRTRIRLLVVLVVVGLPALIATGVVIFVASGGVERRVEAEFAARLPGTLRIQRIEIATTHKAIAHDVDVYAPGTDQPILSLDRVVVEGGFLLGSMTHLEFHNMQLNITPASVAWGRTAIAHLHASDSAMGDLTITASGTMNVVQRVVVRDVAATVSFSAAGITGDLTAELSDRPLSMTVRPVAGQPAALDLAVQALTIDVPDLCAALQGFGVVDIPRDVVAWLPDTVDLHGCALTLDPTRQASTGQLASAWTDGSASARWNGNPEGIQLSDIIVTDQQRGTAAAELQVAYADQLVHMNVSSWRPGPLLGIPATVPVDALLVVMPCAELVLKGGESYEVQVRLRNERNTAWISGRYRPDAPIRIDGGGLPLDIANSFMPPDWKIEGGSVQGLSITWDKHLQRALLDVSDLTMRRGEWSYVDLDGSISIDALDELDVSQGVEVRLDVPFGSIIHRGVLPDGQLELTIVDVNGLVEHIQGPQPLPRCGGFIKCIADVTAHDDGSFSGVVRHIGTAGFGIEGFLRNVAVMMSGTYAISKDGAIAADIDGQLHALELGLPGRWLDLALRRPRFTGKVTHKDGVTTIDDLLARAADVDGKPIADGFTTGLQGQLNPGVTGSFTGVIDRIDLALLTDGLGLVPMPNQSALVGESAVTWVLSVADGRVQSLEGVLLPLGVDLGFLRGAISIEGIKGTARFFIKPAADPTLLVEPEKAEKPQKGSE